MINTARALQEFWSGFGVPAYTADTVPDEQPDGTPTQPPYITYSLTESESLEAATHYAQVWFRGTGNQWILSKVDEIKAAIGDGVRIDCDGGCVVIRPSTPFVQLMVDAVPENRYAYINMQINCYHR